MNNSIDYYALLDLDKNTLPKPDSKENRIKLKEILDIKFRQMAPKCHPDKGGDPETFKLLLRAVTILGDEKLRAEYDNVADSTFSDTSFKIDWEKYFSFDANSTAAEFGETLSAKIAQVLNTSIIFSPSLKEHGYNWVFNTDNQGQNLVLSLVQDEDEMLILSGQTTTNTALPFKIHIYFPESMLTFHYDKTNAVKMPGVNKYLVSPVAKYVSYSDITLISTTEELLANEYIDNQLSNDINLILKGQRENVKSVMEDEKELVTTEQFKERDKKLLQDIFQVKTPKLEADEKGDEFLKSLKHKPIKRITETTIKLKKDNSNHAKTHLRT